MPWRTKILQHPQGPPCSRKHMYRHVWSLPMNIWMIQRRTVWKCCWSDETEIELFGINSTRRVWRRRNAAYYPRTPSPPSNMEVENIMLWGYFSVTGTWQLHRIKGTMDGAKYHQGQGIEASQDIENGPWMGIPAWQWPKTHGQCNKGVGSRRITLRSWSGLASLQTFIP